MFAVANREMGSQNSQAVQRVIISMCNCSNLCIHISYSTKLIAKTQLMHHGCQLSDAQTAPNPMLMQHVSCLLSWCLQFDHTVFGIGFVTIIAICDGGLLLTISDHKSASFTSFQLIHDLCDQRNGLQELLRHYGLSEEPAAITHRSRGSREGSPTETNTLFLHLPADIQNVARPYLDSKFQLQSNTLRATGVIFKPDMSFRRWLASWMRQLTEHHASGLLLPCCCLSLPTSHVPLSPTHS